MLFGNSRITKLNLSQNDIGKKGVLLIAKLLKERDHHLEWLDISKNDFNSEQVAIAALELGLRQQKNLYHLAIDMSPKEIDIKANQKKSGKISSMLSSGNQTSDEFGMGGGGKTKPFNLKDSNPLGDKSGR